MDIINQIIDLLPLILPIVIIEIGLRIYAIFDIYNPNRVIKGNKIIWVLVTALVSLGWLVYFLFGRDE